LGFSTYPESDVIIVSDSELYDSIVQSIKDFSFGAYNLDEIEDTKEEPWAQEWIQALARKIETDWCNYVDGL